MLRKKRIAIYQNILTGRNRRGPDIFFPTFFREYVKASNTEHELFYFLKTDNVAALRREYAAGELDHKNVIILKEYHNRLKVQLETIQLLWKLLRHRISLLHVLTYTNMLDPLPQLKWLQWLSPVWKVKRAFVITYDGIPTAHRLGYTGRYNLDVKYENLFRRIHFHGIYSWYDDFVEWAHTSGVFVKKPLVRSIHSRFCDTVKYFPAQKKQQIVWASALVDYKRPDMFIEAIGLAYARNRNQFDGWQILVYGNGPMEAELRSRIEKFQLSNIIELHSGTNNLSQVLNQSMCYISTQELENFPSLAMNEAMAAGNVIIARNVGRTYLFVHDKKNGYLSPTDDANGIAHCIEEFLAHTEHHLPMMLHSRNLCETIHTPQNFIREIDTFWSELVQ